MQTAESLLVMLTRTSGISPSPNLIYEDLVLECKASFIDHLRLTPSSQHSFQSVYEDFNSRSLKAIIPCQL